MGIVKKLYEGNVINTGGESIHEVLTAGDGSPIGIAIADVEEAKLHCHKKTAEWYIILQGRAEITLNGDKFCAEKDTLVYIKPNTNHRAKRIGGKKLKILAITHPPWTEEDHRIIE